MKAGEFLRKVHALARRRGVAYRFIPARGKGSHGTLQLGSASTVVKDRKKEVGRGLLRAMCKDLGISPEDFKE